MLRSTGNRPYPFLNLSGLPEVLRTHPEPCQYIDESTVHAALTREPAQYLAFIEQKLRAITLGNLRLELPAKQIFTDAEGDFRIMPCVLSDKTSRLKTIKLVGTNIAQMEVPDQITVGRAFCLHPTENFITHIFEACLLSSARTGAIAAIGIKRLGRSPRRIAVIGAGRVGYYTALYASSILPAEEIVFYDLRPERAEAAAKSLAECRGNSGIRFTTMEKMRLQGFDAVVLATTSAQPLLGPADTDARLVVSLGADTEDQRELHASWAKNTGIYVDTPDSIHVGDLRAWTGDGLIKGAEITSLLDLMKEKNLSGASRRLFIGTGSALWDNLTIGYFLSQQKEPPFNSP